MENIRILVVDDDKEIANAIDKILTMEGYKVVKAYDGLEALDIIRTTEIQLILLDIMMPKLDGLSTTLKIRGKNNIPIIILSANRGNFLNLLFNIGNRQKKWNRGTICFKYG